MFIYIYIYPKIQKLALIATVVCLITHSKKSEEEEEEEE
jgi:hypothetical protein